MFHFSKKESGDCVPKFKNPRYLIVISLLTTDNGRLHHSFTIDKCMLSSLSMLKYKRLDRWVFLAPYWRV